MPDLGVHAEVRSHDCLADRLALVVVGQQRVLVSLVGILADDLLEGRVGLVLAVEGIDEVRRAVEDQEVGHQRYLPPAYVGYEEWAMRAGHGDLATHYLVEAVR